MGGEKPKRRKKFLIFPTEIVRLFLAQPGFSIDFPQGHVRVFMVARHFSLCGFLLS